MDLVLEGRSFGRWFGDGNWGVVWVEGELEVCLFEDVFG